MSLPKLISLAELQTHSSEKDCWVVINQNVYNFTEFLEIHPGGVDQILPYAGCDATKAFFGIHNKEILNSMAEQYKIGQFNSLELKSLQELTEKKSQQLKKQQQTSTQSSSNTELKPFVKPDIEAMLNIYDFENVASKVMAKQGFDYYASGGDDEMTLRENQVAFQRIWLKPRVLVDMKKIDMTQTILGTKCSIPLYITCTAVAKLADPEGETALMKAAWNKQLIYMIPTLASCSLDEILDSKHPQQHAWFQLYMTYDRKISENQVRKAEARGCKALILTVDVSAFGNRERDQRNKLVTKASVQKKDKINEDKGVVGGLKSYIDPSLNWNDVKWLQTITKLPIVLKGIQCAEDAIIAYKNGIRTIILSNHGGRQLDYARSAIEILPEVMQAFRELKIQDEMEVLIDGGIRRGTDIFKALALGAKGVGIGRPFLYALASYGQQGVEKAVDIFTEELKLCMQLMGTPTLKDIKQSMLVFRDLNSHYQAGPKQYSSDNNYKPLSYASSKL